MNNEINLSKYPVRSDLAIENLSETYKKNIDIKKDNNVTITKVYVDDNMSKEINKAQGEYVTIEFEDITDFDNREKVGKILEIEIKNMLKKMNIEETDEALIIGLGNEKSTPDALGPKTIHNILVTRHLFELTSEVKSGIRNVSAIAPGVMGETGIETIDLLKSVIESIKPKFLIVIDALASLSISRVNKTIQMTDSGISPGSGVGNKRKEISKNSIGIPVLAIGVPTVVDAVTIVSDTIHYLLKHFSYSKDNFYKNRLTSPTFQKNYREKLEKSKDLTDTEKENLIGLIGSLDEEEKKRLISEVLTSLEYNLIVTPKEIDFLIDKLSDMISSALNNALHLEVTHY